jgi:putative ABC transport system permease protein
MSMFDDLRRDLRFAARGLLRSPGFAAVAVLAIALGIGANSAIFSVVNAVLLRPLPYRDPGRLVTVLHDGEGLPPAIKRQGPASPADFLDWKAQNHVFERMAAAQAGAGNASLSVTLLGRGIPEELPVMSVTAELFSLLGVPALLGRTFAAGDDQPGVPRGVVLGYGLWQRRFAADPAVVGQTITLGARTFTVIGVMPPGFQFAPFWYTKAELWLPLVLGDPDNNRLADREGRSLRVFARLAPGVTRAQAQAEMDLVVARLEERYPSTNRHLTVAVDPLHEKMVGGVRRPLLVLLAAVAFVLLIGCANVANLLLARSAARAKEIALRTVLGASRGRLVRQMLAESLLLAVVGGALGVLLAEWGIEALVALGPRDLPRLETIHLDGRVLAFTAGLSLLTGLLFGLVPAWHAAGDVGAAIKEGGRGATEGLRRNRLRSLLVVSETALALLLLIGAGLMIKSFRRMQAIDPGFDARHLSSLVVQAPAAPERRRPFFDRLLARVRELPGVTSASAINHLPVGGDVWANNYVVEGRPPPAAGDEPSAVYRASRPGYLATMGIALVAGRDFTALDREGARPVMLVNEAFARASWPDGQALGRHVRIEGDSYEVVGVLRDARQEWTQPAMPEMYLPELQQPARGYLTLVVRTAGDPAGLAAQLQREVRALDADLPPPKVERMDTVIATALWQPRFNLLLLNVFAGLALVLAAVGIYGVMAYSVSRRTRELGVRVALGATAPQVHGLVVGQGMALTGAGVLLGLVASLAATRAMASLLYGVEATDPATFAVIPLVLLAVGFVACWLPARRATRVDPMIALRRE